MRIALHFNAGKRKLFFSVDVVSLKNRQSYLCQNHQGLNTNKNKILNDPIYGFITISSTLLFDLIEHKYFQRLRRISQLGLSYLVYPGAYHTRFHHALGAMHLMQRAVSILRQKGHDISPEEEEGVLIAILLHDVGHGPFSHALETTLIPNTNHEVLSTIIMERLNHEFDGKLSLAIDIFSNVYHKKFLHQLIASQLDMDRLDYLRRDSFYTGVTEGAVNSERLLTMLNVKDDELVIDAKGIYSVEKFIVARRLMYWQVYLHKSVISAEFMLVNILKRAKELTEKGIELFATSALQVFLKQNYSKDDFRSNPEVLDAFMQLDDYDILSSIKEWSRNPDFVLSQLSKRLVNRQLFKIELRHTPFTDAEISAYEQRIVTAFSFHNGEEKNFLIHQQIENHAYNPKRDHIKLLYKDGSLKDISQAADQLNISVLTNPVKKHFVCFPSEIRH